MYILIAMSTVDASKKPQMNIRLYQSTRARLVAMSDEDGMPMSVMIERLINEEAARREMRRYMDFLKIGGGSDGK